MYDEMASDDKVVPPLETDIDRCLLLITIIWLLKLPSERTLRDYTHFVKSLPGFQDDIDQLLVEEVKQASRTQNESNKFMALLLDKVNILN